MKKSAIKLLFIGFVILNVKCAFGATVGSTAFFPAGSPAMGSNTSAMIIGISPPVGPIYTGSRTISVAYDVSVLPAWANLVCIVPTVDNITQATYYFNHIFGLISMSNSGYCQDRPPTSVGSFNNYLVTLPTPGLHTVGAVVFAGYKATNNVIIDGVPSFDITLPFMNSVYFQTQSIPINVVESPPLVSISAIPNPVATVGDNVSVPYRSNIPGLGTNAVSCTASSNSITPLNNWNGPIAVNNSFTNVTVLNVGPITVPTTLTLTCLTAGGVQGSASVIVNTPLPPLVAISATPNPVSVGGNLNVWYRSNVPGLGTDAVSCTASSNSITPLNNWNGPKAVSNVNAGVNVPNVGPITVQTILTITCLNASGVSASASVTVNTTTCIDSGLRLQTRNGVVKLARETQVISPLRFVKNGQMGQLKLVFSNHPEASPLKVRTRNGIRSVQKCP